MRNFFVSMSAFLVVMSFYSCNRDAVTLDYTNAVDEVPQLGNLVFRFNKSVVSDSVTGSWDSTEYVSFEPAIPGRFRWEHPDELVFSPARPLPAATSFKATLNKSIVAKSEFGRIEKGDEISFRTPDLKLEGLNMLWVLAEEASKLAVPQVDISFNYPVDPNALKEKLQVSVDDKKADFAIQTLSASNKISLRLLNIKPEDRDYDAEVTVAQGLIPEGGKNGIKENADFKSIIPSPYVLTINEITSEVEGGEQVVSTSPDAVIQAGGSSARISVKTSQQIADLNPAAFVKLDPAIKFRTEITDEGFAIIADNLDASRGYSLTLLKGLRGKIGGVLKENYEESLAFGELQPGIHFASNKAVYLSAQGTRNIEVRLTNLPKVKLIISKIYENNILMSQRVGYYPGENGNEETEYNEPTPGDIIYEKVIETASLPKYGNNRLLNFNFEDKIPDLKGIYHISIRSTEDYWISDNKFVSLSDRG